MTTATAPRANRYAGKCRLCDGWVPAGAGLLTGSRAAGWATQHRDECPPATPRPANAEPARHVCARLHVANAEGPLPFELRCADDRVRTRRSSSPSSFRPTRR